MSQTKSQTKARVRALAMQVCSSLELHLPTVRHLRSRRQPLPGAIVAVVLDTVRTRPCASSFVSLCDTIWGRAVTDSHCCIVLLLRIGSSSIFPSCQRIRLHSRRVPATSSRHGERRRRNHQSWICMTFGQLLETMR